MGSIAIPDFDAPTEQTVCPSYLAHFVLRTPNLQKLTDFYTAFLGAKVVFGNPVINFITYDEESHRVAIMGVPDSGPKQPTSFGLEHVSFAFATMSDLLLSYRQRKAKGIKPFWCVNHGPTTSIYYRDPDGNMLETQYDNLGSTESLLEYIESEDFKQNPFGVDFDPEDFIARLKRGESEAELTKRPTIGPRGIPDLEHMPDIE